MNMVERVAKAICDSFDDDYVAFERSYLSAARFAIAAMREPDEGMIEAICEARNMVPNTSWTDGTTEGVQAIERMLAEKSHQSAIDSALKEEVSG